MRDIRQESSRQMAKTLDAVADRAVAAANAIVDSEMEYREGRRHKKGTRHLSGSFKCEVIWDGVDWPVTLEMRSVANERKVEALEFGAEAHSIFGNPYLYFSVPPKAMKYSTGKPGKVRATEVDHPGNAPYEMMQRALESAVQEAYGIAIDLHYGRI